MKKILALILTALFLLTPVFAFPASAAALSKVELTNVRAPLPYSLPDYRAFCKTSGCDISDYNKGNFRDGVAWYDIDASAYLAPSDRAQPGHHYRFYAYLEVTAGNTFAVSNGFSAVQAKVNGSAASVMDIGASGYRNSEKEILISCDFPACAARILTEATVSAVKEPVAETFVSFAADGNYDDHILDKSYSENGYVSGVKWICLSENNRPLDDTDRFLFGKEYRVYVRLKARPGRDFAVLPNGLPDVKATLNGKSALTVGTPGLKAKDGLDVFCDFTVGTNTVSSVSIVNLAEPAGGVKSSVSCAPADTAYTVTSASWSGTFASGSVFKEGEKYTLNVTIGAGSGCEFASSLTVTVNGKAMQIKTKNKNSVTASCVFTASLSKTITSVNVSGVALPAVGSSPDYLVELDAATAQKCELDPSMDGVQYYIKNGVQWESYRIWGYEEPYGAGGAYKVTVYLKAKDGFEFAHDVGANALFTATVNGVAADYVLTFFPDYTAASVSFTFPSLPFYTISEADVEIGAPAVGSDPHYSALCGSPAYTTADLNGGSVVDGVSWRDTTTGEMLTPFDKFVAGHSYRAYVALVPSEGNKFSTGTLSCTVNGQACAYYGGDLQADLVTLVCDFPALPGGASVIDKVTLQGSLADGVTLSSSSLTAEDARVASVSTEWESGGQILAEQTKAVPGTYMAFITLTAAGGYAFTDDTTVSVFGTDHHAFWASSDGSTLTLNTAPLAIGACDHVYYKIEHDETSHWKVCLTCFKTFDKGEHAFSGEVGENGKVVLACEECGYVLSSDGTETQKPADTAAPDGTAARQDTSAPEGTGAHEQTDPDGSGKRSVLPWILLIAAFALGGGAAAFFLLRQKGAGGKKTD